MPSLATQLLLFKTASGEDVEAASDSDEGVDDSDSDSDSDEEEEEAAAPPAKKAKSAPVAAEGGEGSMFKMCKDCNEHRPCRAHRRGGPGDDGPSSPTAGGGGVTEAGLASPSPLLQLPVELLGRIADLLPAGSVLSVRAGCRRLRVACDMHSVEGRARVALHAAYCGKISAEVVAAFRRADLGIVHAGPDDAVGTNCKFKCSGSHPGRSLPGGPLC